MEQAKKNNLIRLICLIFTALVLEGLLVWSISPSSGKDKQGSARITAERSSHNNTKSKATNVVSKSKTKSSKTHASKTTKAHTAKATKKHGTKKGNPVSYKVCTSRRLTEKDIAGLSKKELRMARNEIYARRGLIFKSADLKRYFSSKKWYKGRYNKAADVPLNDFEKYNVAFIKRHE